MNARKNGRIYVPTRRLTKLLQPCDSRIELQFTAANNVSQPANTSRPNAQAATSNRPPEARTGEPARYAVW